MSRYDHKIETSLEGIDGKGNVKEKEKPSMKNGDILIFFVDFKK